MKSVNKLIQGASLALLFVTGSANAALIDFSSSSWASADGASSYSVGGVTVTAGPTNVPFFDDAVLSHSSSDGLGIDFFDGPGLADEIDKSELLSIDFGLSTQVEAIEFSNFFSDEQGFFGNFNEKGEYRLDAGQFQSFTANSSNGEFTLALGDAGQVLELRAERRLFKGDDFSLKSITTVPEPGTLALLGLGLVGLGLKGRRQVS